MAQKALVALILSLDITGADPRPGKGRGTNRTSCRWLGEPDSLVSCCIFEAANNTPFSSISLLIFTILAFADGCKVLKAV